MINLDDLKREINALNGKWCKASGSTTGTDDLIDYLASRGYITQGWQPIETAPKDGRRFLCYVPKYRIFTCHYDEGFRVMSWNPSIINNPTHWMPLPPPPKGEK